jgi:membrane fusion protein, multidrug efflux system
MHGELPKHEIKTAAPRHRVRSALVWLIVLAAVGGALWYVFVGMSSTQQRPSGRRSAGGANVTVPVLAAQATTADVPVTISAVGTTQALNTVTVKPQVDGKLLSVDFKEGQDVKKGDVLARIDPVLFEAALGQAKAKKAQDEAQLANAQNDVERYQRLAATNAINKQQLDTQKATVAQLTAQVQSDSAAIESAQATLGYTTIRAPIDGRTGIRQVDAGNIVRASDTNGLVVITQLQPIAIVFTIPQQDVQRVNDAFAKAPLVADALRPDSNQAVEQGKLTVVDNQVDPSTGTVKLKAEFPNAQMQLWPGQFVNVRLTVDTMKGVTVIPTAAVQRGPNGTFVYIISQDNKAVMHPINVRKQDETQTVVASGVQTGERVVTTGFVQLTDGKAVTLGSDSPAPAAAAGERARGNGARGNGERRRGEGGGRPRPAGAQ